MEESRLAAISALVARRRAAIQLLLRAAVDVEKVIVHGAVARGALLEVVEVLADRAARRLQHRERVALDRPAVLELVVAEDVEHLHELAEALCAQRRQRDDRDVVDDEVEEGLLLARRLVGVGGGQQVHVLGDRVARAGGGVLDAAHVDLRRPARQSERPGKKKTVCSVCQSQVSRTSVNVRYVISSSQ